MYLAVHPSLVIELNGCTPEVSASVAEFFGQNLSDTNVDSRDPIIQVTCQPVTLPSRANLIGESAAFDDRFLYRRDILGNLIAYRLDGPDHATLVVDPEVLKYTYLSTLEFLLRNLAPARNLAFVHASGVIHEGQGVLFPAWGGTGKTTMVLQFLEQGAGYLGDDTVLLDAAGVMYPRTSPLNIVIYNVQQFESWVLPFLEHQVRRSYLNAKKARRLHNWIMTKPLGKSLPARMFRLWIERMEEQVQQYIQPGNMFPQSQPGAPVHAGTVLFLTRTRGDEFTLTPGDPDTLANRMASCLRWERQGVSDQVLLYQFAFPQHRRLLQEMLAHEEQIIREGFLSSGRLLELRVGNEVSNRKFFESVCETITK